MSARMSKVEKIIIKVLQRPARQFSDALIREMTANPVCVTCCKKGGPFTVSLSMKRRNKPSGIGFVCHECGKLSDRELIERANQRLAEQVKVHGGRGYEPAVFPKPASDITSETLDAFLRGVSEMAELTMSKNKCVPANWIAVTRGGEMHVIPTPMETGDAAGKNRIADDMRLYFADQDVGRYAFVSEGWAASPGWTGAPPAADPNRKPVVTMYVQDDSGALAGCRDIIGDGGPNPTLGPLEVKVLEEDENEGRLANLLGPMPEPATQTIKQFRLNGRPCGDPDQTRVQGDNPADFPDELMSIQQPADAPNKEVVVVTPCRVVGDNRIEMSGGVFSACLRSFVIDRSRDQPIYECSTNLHLRLLPIPASVLAVAAGPMVPNTENIQVNFTSEEMIQVNRTVRARRAASRRKLEMN